MSTMDNLTPKEIVTYLDKYVIGQNDAKKLLLWHLEIVIDVCNFQ